MNTETFPSAQKIQHNYVPTLLKKKKWDVGRQLINSDL